MPPPLIKLMDQILLKEERDRPSMRDVVSVCDDAAADYLGVPREAAVAAASTRNRELVCSSLFEIGETLPTSRAKRSARRRCSVQY